MIYPKNSEGKKYIRNDFKLCGKRATYECSAKHKIEILRNFQDNVTDVSMKLGNPMREAHRFYGA